MADADLPGRDLLDRRFAQRIDWNLLKLFAQIVRAGGIGAAARTLNRQQPTISVAVKRLEEQVGIPLLRRSPTGVEVTAAGKALLQICDDMLESVQRAPHQIAQAINRVEGLVRIQIISSIVSSELDEAILSFHRRHPHIEIQLRVSAWRGVLESLERGEVELGVGYDDSGRTNLFYEPLFTEVQQLYCARSHQLFGARVDHLGGLKDESFVLTGADEPETITQIRRRHGLGATVTGRAEDIHEARRLISLGVGIGYLPVGAALEMVERGILWPMLPDTMRPTYDIFLIARAETSRDTPTQLFLDEIMRRLAARH